jgi:tetratricopeptide (TPR) repeat protein
LLQTREDAKVLIQAATEAMAAKDYSAAVENCEKAQALHLSRKRFKDKYVDDVTIETISELLPSAQRAKNQQDDARDKCRQLHAEGSRLLAQAVLHTELSFDTAISSFESGLKLAEEQADDEAMCEAMRAGIRSTRVAESNRKAQEKYKLAEAAFSVGEYAEAVDLCKSGLEVVNDFNLKPDLTSLLDQAQTRLDGLTTARADAERHLREGCLARDQLDHGLALSTLFQVDMGCSHIYVHPLPES